MPIRGPKQNELQHTQKPARQQPASPLQRLMDFGSARTPSEAKKLVSELLAGLRAAGFPVAKTGNADGELAQALKLFQKERGLPQTGVMDKETHEALVDAGHLPQTEEAAPAKPADKPGQFDLGARKLGGEFGLPRGDAGVPDGAKAPHAVELEQAVDKSTRDKPPEIDLKSFLSSLRAAGFAGAGKGAEQLKDALKKLQKAEGLPQTGQLDRNTAEALVKRGIVDERAMPLTTSSQAQESARTAATEARSDPTTRGAPASETEAAQGRGDDAKTASASGKDAGGGADGVGKERGEGAAAKAASDGAGRASTAAAEGAGDVDDPWKAGNDGNAPAGDDDVSDTRRGHANIVDDAFEHEEGHWQVVSLAEQINAGLFAIVRDDDGTGAATYAWDFTLYRPGVYGKKQPAEKLFHLVVAQASAFDTVWEQARAALNDKLDKIEPESTRIVADDFGIALRVARYRT